MTDTLFVASYIVLAKELKLTLVTEDQRLSRIAKKYVRSVSHLVKENKGSKTFTSQV